VLQTRRHLKDLQNADVQELSELGPSLAAAVTAVASACEAQKVYVLMTNERGHVHFDLIPRYEDDPQLAPEALALREPPPGILRRSEEALMARMSDSLAAAGRLDVERL
jgi:diadenosine tetraphosphate (Ap4A) HIT family hydrolase